MSETLLQVAYRKVPVMAAKSSEEVVSKSPRRVGNSLMSEFLVDRNSYSTVRNKINVSLPFCNIYKFYRNQKSL